ncbi:hypothetical protein PENANT_c033G07249 [Penicillium antarcticum]|uniref:Kinesin motor domain-containing protein n=1 Tax=Penicillium antarcticum TaxID=416450 RepID=A0A1V6PUZ1_9EURO|nr:hypothetical protein PENANT_c033G07249 [Penicillium antarcticum]
MDSLFFDHRDYFADRVQKLIAEPDTTKTPGSLAPSDTSICVRVRPLSEQEKDANHVQGVITQHHGRVKIHEAIRKFNGKPDVKSTSFSLDEVFGSDKATQDIYDDKVQQLVEWAWNGGTSIMLAYGQTGSGKTFTVTALERLVVQALLDTRPEKKEVHMCIFEIFGNVAYDLLGDRKQINILEDSFGSIQIVGALEKTPTNVEDLLSLIETAKSLRLTADTTKNERSSRSHAICRLRIIDTDRKGAPEGTFFLVDLAGSEASADVRHHSTGRMAETREINKSLVTLKDCIRARATWGISQGTATQKHVHIPFRTSTLTKVLKPAFDVNSSRACKTLVIACVAPSMLDVPHSRNTLRYAELLRVHVPKVKPRPYDALIPTTWSNKHVHEWIRKNSGKPTIDPTKLAPHEDGTQLCKLQLDEFTARATVTVGVRQEQAQKLYIKLWSLHIDSRARLRNEILSGSSKAELAQVTAKPKIQKELVSRVNPKPGTFFRLGDDGDIVMVMGKDSTTMFVCAELSVSDAMANCYELFVARQRVVPHEALGVEVSVDALILLFIFCDSTAYAFTDTLNDLNTENNLNLRGAIVSDGAGLPLALDSFNGLETRDNVDEDGESNGLDLVRRYPNAAKSLGNNQFVNTSLEIGDVQWFYLPSSVVNGKHASKGAGLPAYVNATDDDDANDELRKRDGLEKRSTTVYLSLTTCRKPTANTTTTEDGFPQLQMYVSKSETLQEPGPGHDDSDQDVYTAEGGYIGIEKDTDSDVFIGVAAPNSTGYSGGYTYQLAASIDAYFHNVVDNDPFLYFVDADVSAALLVTNNLTQAEKDSDNYQQWMNMTPPYTMFAHNINNTALVGLERSFCALDELSQVGRISKSVEVGMTSRGLGNRPKEQFYITGLNQSSSYNGILAMVGNSTTSGNGIVGGGGQVWEAMNFTTKADDNCAVLFNLTFCSEVAYAVPSNPKLSVAKLREIYDTNAAHYYQNFNYSLQQVQCKTDQESMFSLAVDCDDCATAYKQWLCSVSIPRCADFSNNAPYLAVRNAGQDFINGSSLPVDSPYRQHVASNTSRNKIIDTEIQPGPYKEILPCEDICSTLVKDCPSKLGFKCPSGRWLNASYGYRNSDGDITCSYLGAAYHLSLGL